MALYKRGRQSFVPGYPVVVTKWASIAGKKESEGPLASGFDQCCQDTYFGEKTWEQGEKRMQQMALTTLMEKAGLSNENIDMVFS